MNLAWCGCAVFGRSETKVVWLTPSVLTNLNRGISLSELRAQTGCEPQHQFTARFETNDATCVELSIERPRGRLYFLFLNGKLASIQQPPKAEIEMATYRGKPWEKTKPIHPEEQMFKIIHGEDLSADEIVELIRLWAWQDAERARGEEPNVLPVYVILAPLFLARAPDRAAAVREAASLAEQFDPFKIKLGMTTNETQAVFGEPELRIKRMGNCMEHVYGSKLSPFAPAVTPSVWVSVVFQDGRVTRIFSHDFFDKRLVNGVP